MLLNRIVVQGTRQDGSPSEQYDVWFEFKCDYCNEVYRKRPRECTSARNSKSGLTYCANVCKHEALKKGGGLQNTVSQTCVERYGVPVASQAKSAKDKMTTTNLERYGVESVMQMDEMKAKRRRTHRERYGVDETFQSGDLRKKREKTWQQKYGVPYRPLPGNAVELSKKAMEIQPIKWSSKAEARFGELLRVQFGEVKHQKCVNGWPIDFYIASIDTYVQFDGVYWHGLDRPIEAIRASKLVRDQAIAKKWDTDRKQDAWFAANGKRLVRVTDLAFRACSNAAILLKNDLSTCPTSMPSFT